MYSIFFIYSSQCSILDLYVRKCLLLLSEWINKYLIFNIFQNIFAKERISYWYKQLRKSLWEDRYSMAFEKIYIVANAEVWL
jgi:hypothetical protein